MIEVSVILALSRSHQVTIRKEKWFKGRLARQVVIAARHDSRHVPTRAFAQRSTSTSWFTWHTSPTPSYHRTLNLAFRETEHIGTWIKISI